MLVPSSVLCAVGAISAAVSAEEGGLVITCWGEPMLISETSSKSRSGSSLEGCVGEICEGDTVPELTGVVSIID
jgi:hypothetical protein